MTIITQIIFFLFITQTLFGQVTYTFTNCGATGSFGPTQEMVISAYNGTALDGAVTVNEGIQLWDIPFSGYFKIEVYGAQGGDNSPFPPNYGGKGAYMSGVFLLNISETLKILVGQSGVQEGRGASGGGGTFVSFSDNSPLIIAGGGGGASYYYDGENGSIGTSGTFGGTGGGSDGYGGEGCGNSDNYGNRFYGGGGGGYYGDGSMGCYGGIAFINGGIGGQCSDAQGGFGGGGSRLAVGGNSSTEAAGGGGGYSGGGGSCSSNYSGGGGGSYNNGESQNNSSGYNAGEGLVIITSLQRLDYFIEGMVFPTISGISFFEYSGIPYIPNNAKLISNVLFSNGQPIQYNIHYSFVGNSDSLLFCFDSTGFFDTYGLLADSLKSANRLLYDLVSPLPDYETMFYILYEDVFIDSFNYDPSNYIPSSYNGPSLEKTDSGWGPSFGNGTPGRENGKGRISLPQDADPFHLNLLPYFNNPVSGGDVEFALSTELDYIVYPYILDDSVLVVTPLWYGNDHITITAFYEDGTQQERRMLVSLNNVFLDVPSQTTEFATIDTLDLNTWFSRMPQYGVFTFSVSSSDSTIVAPSIVQDTLLVLQNHWFGQVDLTLTITSNNDGSYNQTFPVVVPNPFASIIPNQIITDDTSQTHNLIQWFPHPVSGDVSLSVSSSNTDIVQTTLVQDTLIQLDVLNDASSIYGFTDVIIWANYPFSHSVSDTFVLTHSPGNQLVINEIHYNPAGSQGSDSEFEFIELSNSSNHTIRLENTLLSNEINFGFSETNAILPDSFVVVARDRDALLAWYPNLNSDIVFEGFTELLSNTNGSIKLTFNGYALDSLTYSDTDPWPSGADGIGPSVELVNQTLNNEYGENWQVSTSTGGTPGYQNSVYDIQVPTWSQSPPNLVFDEDADTTLAFSIWYNIVTDNSPDSLLVFSFLNTGVIHPLVNGDSVNFTIDANWNGETDIGVRVSDGALFSEETIHIIVNPVNDAPTITAINDTSYVEDNSLNFVLTSTDIDSDNLVYSAFSDTTAISVTVSDSLISFTSSLNWNGSSLITAMVSDGEYSDSTNFTLTVNPVNDAPTITVITDTTFNEDDLLSFVLSSFDIDEDDVSYFAFTDTSAVQVSITDSLLTITTNANWNGSSLITAMVSDGEYSDSTNFTLTVNPVNDAPVLTQQFLDVNILEDDFGAILIPRIEDYFMEVDSNDIMQFYANTFDAGLDSIVFISESDGLLARGFSMNEKPTKKSHFKRVKRQNYVQTKNKSQKISNNNSFFQTVINRSSNRNNNDTTACIVYPSLNFTGEINIEIMATDLMEITTHDTLKLTIEPVNDPPVISSQSDITIFEDDSTNFTIVAIDVDSENLIYEVISSSSELTISLNNENCTLIPNENWFGESQITLIVSDDEYSDTTEFVLSVLSVNDLPILETPLPDFTLDEDNGEIIILERLEDYFTDVDTITGDSLRFYLSSNTAGLDSLYLYIEPNSTGIYLLPKDNYFGEINIIVTATDDSMATVSDTFLLEILNVNDPPIITVQQTAVTNEETPIAIPFSVFDEEGANVFMSSFVDTSAVSITTTDTNLVITPYLNWFGEANVFLTADDGDTTVTDTILLTVANVNDAPVLLSEFSQFILSGKIAIPLFVNEVDGDEIQAIGAFRLSQSDSWQMMNVNTDTSYAGNVAFSVEWETLDKTGNQINWAYSETAECSLWVNDGLVNSNTLVFDSLTIANIAGDYNLDAKINAGDIGQLVGAFYQEGAGILDIDIGPSTGTAPFVTTVQDSVIDFEDLATFTQSWYWGAENLPGMNRILLAKSIQNDGNEIFTLRAKSNRILSLNISELITEGFDLFIQYDTTEIQFETIQHEISNSAISMSSHIPEMGYFSLSSFSKNGMMDFSGNLVEIVVSSGLADAVEIIVGIKRYENSSDDSPFVYARKTIEWVDLLPKEFALHQNYPNPFNPTTTLRYDLPEDSKVSLIIYDIMGREVKRLVHVTQEAGFKSVLWNGKNNHGSEVSAGMYLYRISAGNFISVKKMVLLK